VCCAVKGAYHYVTLQISEEVCQVKCESCAVSAGKNVFCNFQNSDKYVEFFDVLLTVHLNIILVINQHDARNFVL